MALYTFKVAELPFRCQLPDNVDIRKYLPSFSPFYCKEEYSDPSFELVCSETVPDISSSVLLEKLSNDMGDVCVYRADSDYIFSFSYVSGSIHYLQADPSFSRCSAYIIWEDQYASIALTSLLRTIFSQRIIFYDGISIHSSVISRGGKGYLFLGKSGTGKSTHTRLWLKNIPGASLLNDDNPICRFIQGKLMVYGSPWSGKTACYKNECAEVVSFVRLEQAPVNEFKCLKGVLAWAEVFPSCSILKDSRVIYDKGMDVINKMVSHSIIGHMKCLPDNEAAMVCECQIRQS